VGGGKGGRVLIIYEKGMFQNVPDVPKKGAYFKH
jgi:hypothetical protein